MAYASTKTERKRLKYNNVELLACPYDIKQ
jgi:hypothetical protein